MNGEQEHRCREVVELYTKWLNRWIDATNTKEWTVEHISSDDFYGKYGTVEVLSDESNGYHRIMHIEAGYGDDGGNSELLVVYEKDLDEPYAPNSPIYICQMFDTGWQEIFNDSGATGQDPWRNTPTHKGYTEGR